MKEGEAQRPEERAARGGVAAVRGWFFAKLVFVLLLVWAGAAYLLLPRAWEGHYKRHPFDSIAARVTTTGDGHPGDPVNIALVGTEAEVIGAMIGAGWYPADPITLKSSLAIAVDSVLRRSDDEAPVSNLFLFGRKQDLAFEQPVKGGPSHRHHVRFWKWEPEAGTELAEEWAEELKGLPLWFGAATYDDRVGLSYATGQITHHVAADVDAERDRIVEELDAGGWVKKVIWRDGFHPTLEGRNGGGDLWKTDGRLAVVQIAKGAKLQGAK